MPNRCIAVALIVMSSGATAQEGPRVKLRPDRAHIAVLAPDHWDLKLFDRPDMKGRPAIHLRDEGLFVDGRKVCGWPGGRWDKAHEMNMVLGYDSLPHLGEAGFHECGIDLPLLSTWGDDGIGAAVVLIEVFRVRGTVVEARYGNRSVYLDLNTLPGDPIGQVPASLRPSRPDGFPGWDWRLSDVEDRRRPAESIASLRRDPSFARFLTEVRTCLESSRVPQCMAAFISSPYYDSEAAAALGRPRETTAVTADEYVRYAWGSGGPDYSTRWSHLRACFLGDRIVYATPTMAQFEGQTFCEVERGPDGWKLRAMLP
jgi:hypothetical protein